jgi:tyrosinase
VQALPEGARLYLVVKNLQTNAQPGVLYNVYLDLPDKATKKQLATHHVGMLNFFGAMAHGTDDHGKAKKSERFISFDITNLAKTLQTQNLLNEKSVLTIVPAGEPNAAARPVIGEVSLVQQ